MPFWLPMTQRRPIPGCLLVALVKFPLIGFTLLRAGLYLCPTAKPLFRLSQTLTGIPAPFIAKIYPAKRVILIP